MRCKVVFVFAVCLLAGLGWTRALAEPLTVVYPQVKAPYDEIFKQIIQGIEYQQQGNLQLVALDANSQLQQIAVDIAKDPGTSVIALGKSGYQVARQIQRTNPVVVGALPLQSSGLAGISLLTDPKVLLESLKMLAPSVRKVYVVYSESSRWLIQTAIEQAANYDIEIVAEQVTDLKAALSRYQDLLTTLDPATSALWLPLDSITANEQVILPKVLEIAWERNIVLFSSKPEHAKRGVLFSTFPDHFELGRELVIKLQQLQMGKVPATLVPLRQVQLAVNLRTAAHLGMEYKQEVLRKIAITFK